MSDQTEGRRITDMYAEMEKRCHAAEDEVEGLWGVYCDCADDTCDACKAMKRLGLLPPTGQAEAYRANLAARLPDPRQERDAGAEE